ncbi:class I SAM-dependent methyltransferase [Prochlorococcus marinus XMU1412]|uniref:class I SAM-dependent methyltransferase n=1 Tax=Prochlorococcus marinus TaxID=1219 RepID=UPI001ADB380D|nr:class I SAM-dependent methyltransferase [Prochlorococcus marinus]MBO8240550.1 class I SAM-dependent methyltransferase [Prochlorococcus marinus XMU1412]MBW3071786.1 hypothetical protein [Prochlorococcus marinus str. MU1412]
MKEVSNFYRNNPFNFSEDINVFFNSIKNSNQVLEYEDLHKLLSNNYGFKPNIKDIIEFGCGTGWLTNTISYYYKKNVHAVDFTKKAIETAQSVSNSLSVYPRYTHSDIFSFEDSKVYDLVISLGVLHHTIDCHKAFKKISSFVKKGGLIYVGLYHYYGRRPMLKLLQEYSYWHGEKSAYNLFKKMNSSMQDKDHSFSWFRDQVIHPHETQHTLKEISSWIKEIGFELISTSINNYKNLKKFSADKLDKLEKEMEHYSYKRNIKDRKFTPGYFTFCAKKI